MPAWCVGSSVTVKPQLHLAMPTLEKVVVQSTMTRWPATGPREVCLNAPILVLELRIVVTVKMQEWYAIYQVS